MICGDLTTCYYYCVVRSYHAGPYDLRNQSAVSDIRWFHVVEEQEGREVFSAAEAARAARGEAAGRPFELQCAPAGCTAVSPELLADLRRVADLFAGGGGGAGGAGDESADRVVGPCRYCSPRP